MKILMANKFFYVNGGSETVFFQERDFLLSAGYQVVDFSMQDPRNLSTPYADSFVAARDYRGKNSLKQKLGTAISFINSSEAARGMAKLIETEQPDIVHCHNIYHQLTPSIIGAAHRLGVPVALTLHDYKPVCPSYLRLKNGQVCADCTHGDYYHVVKNRCADGSMGKSLLLYAEAVTQQWLGNYEKVSKVIAPSQFMADSVAHRFNKEQISVIYNGIDPSDIKASDVDDGYVLYLGRLSKEKGIATLLEAYRRHKICIPLKVCGTGPMLEGLSENAPENVAFLGYQSGSALSDIIRKASLVVVPSEWYENCPMSVLEAMAYGKPVIGARIGGIPELVLDRETGMLFTPGDVAELAGCIQVLADNNQLRLEMGRNARKRIEENFTLHHHNQALVQVYQQLV